MVPQKALLHVDSCLPITAKTHSITESVQELAGRLEAVAGQLRPRSSIMVLQAFAAYRVPVPGLASALAESLDPHLSGLS